MNVVDSSAWLEYFAGGPNADVFAKPIENTGDLAVPTLCLYEVYKRILQQAGEASALEAITAMQQGTVLDLSAALSIEAARLGHEQKLPLADSIILATTRAINATLWTQDADFEGMKGVVYRPRLK